MGCGNSSPTTTNNNSSSNSTAGHTESSPKVSEGSAEEDKWQNYGGVYVGFPTNLSNIPQVQIGSLRESDRDSPSLRKPLWGNGL